VSIEYDKRSSDQHVNRLEDQISEIRKSVIDVVRVESELKAVIKQMDAMQETLNRIDATIQTLNESRMTMLMMTKSVADNEKDIAELKIKAAQRDTRDKTFEWVVRFGIALAGVAISAWAFVVGDDL
jgi:hypothetical protein